MPINSPSQRNYKLELASPPYVTMCFPEFPGLYKDRLVNQQPSYTLCLHSCFNLHLGSMKPISSHDLRAVTNDLDGAGSRTITFTVVTSPRLGRLVQVNPDNSTEDVSMFTQDLVSPDVCPCSPHSSSLC